MIKCSACSQYIKGSDVEYPYYYFGAGPDNPEEANVFFCDANCVYNYLKDLHD